MLKAQKKWWLENIRKISRTVINKKDILFGSSEDQSALKSRYDELSLWVDVLFQQRSKLNELYTDVAFLHIKKRESISGRDRFVCKAEQIMEAHMADADFDVFSFSQEMGMSRVHLYRMMKTFTEQSPSDYIRNYRLLRASHLLTMENETVSEIAYRTGFNDLSHFSKCFKKVFGVCPSEYKKIEVMRYLAD